MNAEVKQLLQPKMSQPMQVLTSHETADWYTPNSLIQLVREVLGSIELDPASCEFANEWIQAERIYTRADDGLAQTWKAETVFCNPPYGKEAGASSQARWSAKATGEYECGNAKQVILLINNTAGYKWWESLWTKYPTCFVRERVRFVQPEGIVGGQAKRGQNFIYMGANYERFTDVFSRIGRVVLP